MVKWTPIFLLAGLILAALAYFGDGIFRVELLVSSTGSVFLLFLVIGLIAGPVEGVVRRR